jgi:flagellar basal-body rod modification protein FlgD
MINSAPKASVNTWGTSNDNFLEKPSKTLTVSAKDQDKFGDKDLGAVLNQIADPNFVDPQKKMRAVGNDKLDKDAFLKLMLAQMKHQDPTSPLKSHEMAAQLASFSSLEQMQNMNTTLTDIRNAQKPGENFQVLSLIGKSVAGDSAKLTRMKGDKDHDIKFTLPDNATQLSVKVRNSAGEIVRNLSYNDLKKGDIKLNWNGANEKGLPVPAGDYNFFIEGKNSSGKKLSVKTDFQGVISGVNYTPEGPILLIGNQTVRMGDVRKIVDPSLNHNDQNLNSPQSQDLNTLGDVNNTKSKSVDASLGGAPEAKPGTPQMMDSLGMSPEMMAKVLKETQGS